ncbi:MAG: 3-dehydroquinate synthase [Coriobacteriia bacterium]|nr:3-dehydroquinate synthase [Coriobacteriia bacterium]
MSHLFLTGFMGAGKSSVGRLVAARLGRPFVDLDEEIERREGSTVPEIFRTRGEDGFREAEHAALEEIVGGDPAVVATGGGVVLRDDNQALLKRHGTVVYLSVTPEEAMARVGEVGDRPLLADGGLAAARSILGTRMSLYAATADHVVDTIGRAEADVAEAVIGVLRETPAARTVRVGGLSDDSGYDVVIGHGLLAESGQRIREVLDVSSAVLVSDETVRELYAGPVASSLREADVSVVEESIAAGEASKSWETAGDLLERFAASGLDRSSAVVALGGGVVGDLAGYCAAAYMRGISLVHLPTTLLAQVDSAVGGKTAVDLSAGKNLAGAFWPPRLVLADVDVLESLPAAEWTNGLVETAKAALLAGGDALARFERDIPEIVVRESAAVLGAVEDAVEFKAEVVSNDLREAGLRECLNLGHTLGHALELLAGYGVLPHGLAVAEGMRFAALLAEALVGAAPDLTERTKSILEAVGAGERMCAPVVRPLLDRVGPDEILGAMKGDKKSRGGVVRFVLLEAPGQWHAVGVDDTVLLDGLRRWRASFTGGGE